MIHSRIVSSGAPSVRRTLFDQCSSAGSLELINATVARALSLSLTLSLAESGCGHINTLQDPSATTLLHKLYVHSLHYLTFLETSFLERIVA